MAKAIDAPVDIVLFVAGYFPDIHETLTDANNPMNFEEEKKQIDICAVGPMRCVNSLWKEDKIKAGTKVEVTQNEGKGGDYGHHMCRAACNIGCVLMSEEFKQHNVPVVMLHPGFNKTEMTAKYKHIWDKEGAVESCVGARRVIHEIGLISMKTSGQFINCEDGLQIEF